MKKNVICICLIMSMVMTMWGCSDEGLNSVSNDKAYTIGVVAKSGKSEYWMSVRSGMEAAAEKLGAKILFFAPDSEEDIEAQEKLAMSLIQRNVDVLAVSPIDAFSNPPYIEVAKKKGIPVVSYDSAFESLDMPYIGIDNKVAGLKMGEYIAKKMGYKGEVGIVSGELDQMCHKERVDGAVKYIESLPDMKVAYIESGYSGAKMSGEKIASLREQHPDVKGLIVTSAVTALGIVEGSEIGNMKIVTIDVQEDALYALQNKKISGLVAQSGYNIGHETVKYVDALRKGKEQKDKVILSADFLTAENVEEYIEKHTQ